jgi:hypothetical protein
MILETAGFAPLKLILPVTVPADREATIAKTKTAKNKVRNINDLLSDYDINNCADIHHD